MFVAAKVGVTAFKVGKLAANTKETFSSLIHQIELWKVQIEYYASYLNGVQQCVPPSMHMLNVSRLKVLQAYIDRLLAKIAKAEGGDKKAKMTLIGKATGEMGKTFAVDIAEMFADLDECIQFSQVHITSTRLQQMKLIDEQLKALGQPGISSVEQQKYHASPMDVVVQSRRLIFLLEFPLIKVATGAKVPISWAVAGDVPFVKIEIQTSSLMQQAKDKNKKQYVTIAEKVACDELGAGQYTWEVPNNFVTLYDKHTNYCLRLTYDPSDDKSKTSRFVTKVKGHSDTFKIYDPSKKDKKKEEHAAAATPLSPTPTSNPMSPSTSTPLSSSNEREKEKEKGGIMGGAMGKASGLMGGFKKKF